MRAWHSPGVFFWNWNGCPLCRGAACASNLQLFFVISGIIGCPSLVLDGCRTCLFLCLWLMIWHRYLSSVPVVSDGGRIPHLMVGISRLVVFSLNAAIQTSGCILFHPFSTVRNGSVRSLYFDWQSACWAGGDWESRFVCFPSWSKGSFSQPVAASSSLRFFPAEFVGVVFGRSSRFWIARITRLLAVTTKFNCRHPGGFKAARFLIDPLKMGYWVQLMTEFVFHPLETFCLDSHLTLVETFGKPPWRSCQDISVFLCGWSVHFGQQFSASIYVFFVNCCCYRPL